MVGEEEERKRSFCMQIYRRQPYVGRNYCSKLARNVYTTVSALLLLKLSYRGVAGQPQQLFPFPKYLQQQFGQFGGGIGIVPNGQSQALASLISGAGNAFNLSSSRGDATFGTRNTMAWNGEQDAAYVRNYVGDPEAEMTVPQIIRRWGYPVEVHRAVTSDGYILELHRIPRGRRGASIGHRKGSRRPPVFLQHGLLCTSSVWVMNLPHQSAGFLFADAGFDVWMGNMRGNSYSRSHLRRNIPASMYWSFSWDEMAKYDLEAMIDYVLNATRQEQLHYVGHSQGTLTMFSKLSLGDGFNKKIKNFFAIAPVGTIAHVKGLFNYLGRRMYDQLLLFTELFGDQEFLPNTILSRWLTEFICGLSTTNPLCENFLFLVSGPDSMQLNKTRIGIYLAHNPAGTSMRNILHYCQMVRHGHQQAYDFGRTGNMKRYGMVIAPHYLISRIKNVPIHLYYSDSDWLATSADVEGHLLKWLRRDVVAGAYKLADFNHNDFLWGVRAADEVYWPIVRAIRASLDGTSSAIVSDYGKSSGSSGGVDGIELMKEDYSGRALSDDRSQRKRDRNGEYGIGSVSEVAERPEDYGEKHDKEANDYIATTATADDAPTNSVSFRTMDPLSLANTEDYDLVEPSS